MTNAALKEEVRADLLRILIVDDEPDIAQILARVLRANGEYHIDTLTQGFDVEDALDRFAPDVVFMDLVMPRFDGVDAIRRIKALMPDVPVVVISAYGTIENAVRTVRAGAFDFVSKPFDPESLTLLMARIEQDCALRLRRQSLRLALHAQDPHLRALRGESASLRRLKDWIIKVRGVNAPALIEGESGTGKELVARAIHADQGPFVPINMATLPEELADSELFGHRRGAFTGAHQDRRGLLVEASGGTLFLDEINSMGLAIQAKLLRVLDEQKLRPVGSDREVEIRCRIVSATNEPLEELVKTGRFRRDLYHRLRVLSTNLPPLRERPEDISFLAEEFLQRYSRAHAKRVRRFTAEAILYLQQLPWTGNVRELENLIEETVILADDGVFEISAQMLRPHHISEPVFDPECTFTLAAVEQRHIARVLQVTNGNKSQAARLLSIDYKTLLRKLAQMKG